MERYNMLGRSQQKNLEETINITLEMPTEHLKAMDGLIPMTYELFCICMESCIKLDAENSALRLMEEYKDLSIRWANGIEETLEKSETVDASEEVTDKIWTAVKKKIETLENSNDR